jgi:hypothetical protein
MDNLVFRANQLESVGAFIGLDTPTSSLEFGVFNGYLGEYGLHHYVHVSYYVSTFWSGNILFRPYRGFQMANVT